MPPPSDLEINLAEGPMPPHNVKDFKSIQLNYFDMSVANFLSQFHQEEGNSLLDNVNSPDNTIMQIIAQLTPLIGNINSIHMCHLYFLFGGENNSSQLLKTMLAKTRILESSEPMSMFAFRLFVIGFMLHGLMGNRGRCASLYPLHVQSISLKTLKRTFQRAPVRSAFSSTSDNSGPMKNRSGRTVAWAMPAPMSDW